MLNFRKLGFSVIIIAVAAIVMAEAKAEFSYGTAKAQELSKQEDAVVVSGLARIREAFALLNKQDGADEAESARVGALELVQQSDKLFQNTREYLGERPLDLRMATMSEDQQQRVDLFRQLARNSKLEAPTPEQALDMLVSRLGYLQEVIGKADMARLATSVEDQRVTYETILNIERELLAISFALDAG